MRKNVENVEIDVDEAVESLRDIVGDGPYLLGWKPKGRKFQSEDVEDADRARALIKQHRRDDQHFLPDLQRSIRLVERPSR
jgi:hypothetical protein